MVRRSTVACSARIRRRLVSRRVIRSAGALMVMASASGSTGTLSSRVRATIGVKARSFFLPAAASALASAATRVCSLHGSASTIASGSTEARAAAASAQPASMIGKAPSARNAATTSTAGLSATTTNGPCSAMFRYRLAGCRIRGTAPDNSQCAVNGASTPGRAAQVRLGVAFAAVDKRLGHDRVDARGIERGLHGVAVRRIANQALPEQRIGQRR